MEGDIVIGYVGEPEKKPEKPEKESEKPKKEAKEKK